MPAATSIVATVLSVNGAVYARAIDGSMRTVKPGDVLTEGELLVAPPGSSAELMAANGEILPVASGVELALTPEMANEGLNAEQAASVDEDVNAVLEALADGRDLNEALDATAAGLSGGGQSDGHSFVILARLAEQLDQRFPLAFNESNQALPEQELVASGTNEALLLVTNPAVTVTSFLTADKTPAFSGTIDDPAASVSVIINGISYAAINNGDGSWMLADNTVPALNEGETSFEVLAENSAGLSATSSGLVVIDSTAPLVSAADVASRDNSPELTGSVDDPSAIVVVTINGVDYPAVNNGDGSWVLSDDSIAQLDLGDTTIIVSATDPLGNTSSSTAIITVNPDLAPQITVTAVPVTEDNISTDTVVANFESSDSDNDVLSHQLLNNENGYFEIVGNSVRLTQAGVDAINDDSLNIESLVIDVEVSAFGVSVIGSDTLLIERVNDAPVIDSATGSTQIENTAVAGDTVATFVASDLEGDNITYSITSGNDDGYFAIDANTGIVILTAAGQAAIEDDTLNLTSQEIAVIANDGVDDSAEAIATITITRVNDNAPTIDTATGSTQIENTAVAGDTVATFVASDLDDDDITYSITSGNDDGYFTIDTNTGVVTLTASGQIAIEDDSLNLTSQQVGVTANDGINDSVEAVANISITRVNDNAPVIDTATGSTQVENTAIAGDTVATFVASDLNGDTITYSITNGNEDGYFAIDTNTGVVILTAVGQAAIENDVLNLANQVIGVTANDGAFDSIEATATIIITHVNDNAPTVDTADGSTQVENTAVAGDTVATFVASDLDGDDITYSITSGNDDGYFAIDINTGVVTLTTIGQTAIENDTLNLTSLEIGVTANDGANDSEEATATITITRVNDNAPTIDTADGSTQVENTAFAGDTVATFVASDLDGDDITYSITSGNDDGYFAIDINTGVVTLTTIGQTAIENDTLNLTSLDIGVTANDGVNDSEEATATVTITRVNDNAPTIDTADGSTQIENTAVAGDTVATFVASDLDGDDITYSITSGNDDGYFIIDTNSGVVTLTVAGQTAIENDTLNLTSLDIGVTANDGANDSEEATATITITRVNDNAPTIDTADGSTQVENTAVAGDTVATFVASDLDGDDITYSITSGNDDGYFIIDTNSGVVTLTVAGQTAIENDTLNLTSLDIGVTANDGANDSEEASVTINIARVNDNAPTIDTADGSTQVENTAVAGDTVATFVASDLDGDDITYSITSGNDDGYFAIDINTGVVTLTTIGQAAIENDTLNLTSLDIGVTANDGVNDSEEAAATITITRVNDNAPTIDTADGSTQVENTAVAGDTVATFVASDLDGDDITYSITSGNDDGYFAIDINTGVVTLTTIGQTAIENDTLNLTSLEIGVTANDGTNNSDEATATITITRVNDNAPTIDTVDGSTQVENTAVAGDTVATFVASDLDGDDITYSITSGNDDGYFAIDINTGVVTLTTIGQTAIENDTLNLTSLDIGVTANDGANDSEEATATVTITRVNDNAPTIDTADGSTQVENTVVAGDTVATFVASDLDGDDITYSITSGNADGYFAIDINTGVVTLTIIGQTAIENDTLNLTSVEIGVTANDGVNDSEEASATITITRVNDNAPTIDTADGSTQVENTAVAGDTVATFVASDLDGDDITYSITNGNADGYFAIDINTGVVTLTTIGQAAIENDTVNLTSLDIGVTANDGVNDSEEATATITITRVNDNAPTIDTADGSTQVENTAVAGDTVATFVASDLDGDDITYSITSGNADGYFAIDINTGVVTLTTIGQAAIENDTLNLTSLDIGVTANDGTNNSDEATATITITRVNDNAPTIDTADGSTQVENTAVAGDTVATFVASDLDGDDITYSITSGNADGYFAIDANTGIVTLTTIGQTAIENDTLNLTSLDIGVTANDGVNDSEEATVTITITRVNDNAPTIDTADGSTQVENTVVAGDTVATFVASDLDGDDITYSITSGNADGYFAIDANTGIVTLTTIGQTAIENDTLNLTSLDIGVTANDGANDSEEATATVTITRVNDNAPTIDTADGSTQVENTVVAGDTVATFVASDLDGDDITYSITSGNADGYFAIDINTGVVTLTTIGQAAIENDTVNLTSLDIGVTANDGVNDSEEATATITITRVNDNAPTIDTADGSTQVENTAVAGDTVATFVASDLDGDDITYSITSGNDDGYFAIDMNTGVVTLTTIGQTAIENDTLNLTSVEIGVTANDGVNDSEEASATITITRVNDNAPTIDTADGSTQVENTAVAGDTVATFVASDLDGDDITYSITNGNADGYFAIDINTGVVTLTTIGQTAIENDTLNLTSLDIGVTANDGTNNSDEATATITITRVNDNAPTIDTADGSTQVENAAVAGDTVATFVASDLDGDDITYSITSGNDDGYFAIDPNTGVVTLTTIGQTAIENDALDLADQIIGVTANDGLNDSAESTATIIISHVNDNAPIVSSNSIAVNEDSVGTNLGLSAPTDADGDALTITVTGLPLLGVVTLANGGIVSDGQLLSADDITGLLYNAPTSYNGADDVGVFSYTVNDGTFSVIGSVDVAVTPIADAPDLSAVGNTSIAGIEGDAIAIPEIQAALNDLSGSESLQLELLGIPLAAVISDGVNSFTALTDNAVLDLSGWDVAALTVSSSTDGVSSQYDLTVRATSTEATTSDTASSEFVVNVTVFDSEPVAVNDSDQVGYQGTTLGNVISGEGGLTNGADTVAFDGARVSSIAFAGMITQIAENATESIAGDSGVLTISSDGSYSYLSTVAAPAPVAVNADGDTAAEWSAAGVDPYGFSSLNDALSSGNLNIASLNSTATNRIVETGSDLGVSGSGSDRINDGEAIVLDLNGLTDEISIEVDNFSDDEQITWSAYAVDGLLLATGTRSDGVDGFEVVVDGMAYIALSSNDTFRLEEVSYSVRRVEPLPADETFSYTLTDGEDESSAVLTVSHVSNSVATDDAAVVNESGLATGSGAGTAAIEATGNLLDNDSGVSAATDISSVTFAGVTATASSGVISIDGAYGSLLVYAQDGTANRAGDYVYTLNAVSSGDDVQESFSYSLSDGSAQPGILNIAIVDDAPVGSTLYESLEAGTTVPVFNLVVILDVSGSMRGDKLALAKTALGAMFDEYDRLGDVNIQIVPFSSNADKSSWYLDNLNGAMNYVDALSANGGTDYDAALNTTMANFEAPQGQTIFYFLSDGEPTEGGGITGSEITNWENFVAGEDAVAFGIGIGTGVSLDNLTPIAYPNSSEYALVVENTAELTNTLLSTVDSNAITGNISVLSVDGEPGIYVGADGGYISRIEIGGDAYTYSPDSNPAGSVELTITTPEGASLQVNFITGEYRYSVDIDQTIVGRQEVINITATDNDGDSLSVDLVVDLNYQPGLDANRDTVITNAGGVVEIPVEALLHNDSGNSNAGFDSVAVGASGTVSVSNGVVSFIPAPQPASAFTNVVENSADSSANALNNSLLSAEDFSDRSLFGVVSAADAALISDDAIPTARFQGTLSAGDSSSRDQDWIRLYLNEGERIILDVDNGANNSDSVDTVMTLRDSNGNPLAINDDANTTQGGLGSSSGLDSYLEYTASSDGYYYVSVTSYSQGDSGDYDLWMSIDSSNSSQQDNFEYTITDGVLSNSTVAAVSSIAGSTVQGGTDEEVLVGGSGADTLIGDGGDDALVGNAGNDILQGGDGDDLLIGGTGEDLLSGGIGADIFSWSLVDAGSAGTPVLDTITDFDTAAFTAGGDAINLKDLLIDESGEDLTNYLQFERVDLGNGEFDTVLHVSSTGGFDSGNVSGGAEQSIVLQGVDLLGTSTDQQALIQDLIATGKLITD